MALSSEGLVCNPPSRAPEAGVALWEFIQVMAFGAVPAEFPAAAAWWQHCQSAPVTRRPGLNRSRSAAEAVRRRPRTDPADLTPLLLFSGETREVVICPNTEEEPSSAADTGSGTVSLPPARLAGSIGTGGGGEGRERLPTIRRWTVITHSIDQKVIEKKQKVALA